MTRPPAATAGRCPLESNGVLEVWRTRAGRLALVCDECDTTWFDPSDVSEAGAVVPDTGTFELPGGDVLERPATRAEIDAAGWTGWLDRP